MNQNGSIAMRMIVNFLFYSREGRLPGRRLKQKISEVIPQAAELKQPRYLGTAFLYLLPCTHHSKAIVLLLHCPCATQRPMTMKSRYHDKFGDAYADRLATANIMHSLRFCFSLSNHRRPNFDLFPFYIPWFSQSTWGHKFLSPLALDQIRLELVQELQQVQKLLKKFGRQSVIS